jgi:hypothetical protein
LKLLLTKLDAFLLTIGSTREFIVVFVVLLLG